MAKFGRLNGLGDIPMIEYSGYLWLSDQRSCTIVDGVYDFSKLGCNPFIVEGELYAKDGSLSVSIRWIGGSYVISKVEWSVGEGVHTERSEYLMHACDKKMGFLQAWEPKEDSLCENMMVMTPTWRAFVGFVSSKKTR
ncbi:MAG: TIGR04423 family type III CRISPR-associated protein [Bacteroidales bacterium]